MTTLPLLLFAAIGSSDRTAAAALGLLVIVPPVVLVLVVARRLRGREAAPGWGRLVADAGRRAPAASASAPRFGDVDAPSTPST